MYRISGGVCFGRNPLTHQYGSYSVFPQGSGEWGTRKSPPPPPPLFLFPVFLSALVGNLGRNSLLDNLNRLRVHYMFMGRYLLGFSLSSSFLFHFLFPPLASPFGLIPTTLRLESRCCFHRGDFGFVRCGKRCVPSLGGGSSGIRSCLPSLFDPTGFFCIGAVLPIFIPFWMSSSSIPTT